MTALDSPLVSTQWLADHLGTDKLIVLDATVLRITQANGQPGWLSGHEQYIMHGHIPGAQFADLLETFSDPDGEFAFTKPGKELFESAAGSVGIDNDTTVVVYDSSVGEWASRVWWLFRTWGYDSVAVLDGGFTKWQLEDRETESGYLAPTPASFVATERPELWVDKAYVEAIVSGETDAALVCGVPAREYSGEATSRSRAGHIPGSINVPAARLVDRDTRAVLSQDELRKQFEPVVGARRVVLYCGAGIAAAAGALAMTLLGERNVAIYDGSLGEWVADPDRPLVTTAG